MAREVKSVEEFEQIIKGDKLTLVDFWATWCGPCLMMAPVLDEFASRHPEVNVIKVNVDQFPDLAGRYGIMSIPTMILFKQGSEIQRVIGFMPVEILEQQLSPSLQQEAAS